MSTIVEDEASLRSLYPQQVELRRKTILDRLDRHCRNFIAHSPFLVLATAGADGGVDASPRGDAPGFVQVLDDRTLAIPDRRGNNRLDSMSNISARPQVGLLFFIPGIGETLRVNGRARISVEPTLLESFAIDGKAPKSVIAIMVEAVYFQCARAILRSELWNPQKHVARGSLPSAGQILAALSNNQVGGEAYDKELPERQRTTPY